MVLRSNISIVALYIILTAGAYAATMYIYDGADIVGLSGLEIDGQLWDVDFLDGSYDALVASGNDLLVSPPFATAATDSLFAFYNSNPVTPDTFLSCDSALCIIGTPYEFDEIDIVINTMAISINAPTSSDITGLGAVNDIQPYSDPSNFLYASYSPVPLPAAVWLFTFGLIGFIGLARRKDRA